jgi:glycosyltransferase involved in cell wall biosynthesis
LRAHAAPAISVVLPVLNAAPFLGAAIESILGQTFADLELIVVDDGSDDESLAIAGRYARDDVRVRVFALRRDPAIESGARAANLGLEEARGDYIARMDADDIASPERLEVELAWLTEHGLDACGGQLQRFGDRPGPVWYPESHEGVAHELIFRASLTNPTMLARADVMKAVRYNETECAEEYDFLTRLAPSFRTGNCPAMVLRLRCHPGQTTRRLSTKKLASQWRRRFAYFFQLFPEADLADFRCVHAAGWDLPLGSPGELERLGGWLVRLSRLPEVRLRQRMARRWTETCERSAAVADLRADFEARILAAP